MYQFPRAQFTIDMTVQVSLMVGWRWRGNVMRV